MASRLALVSPVVEGGGNYFSSPKSSQEFITSGCTLLDCVLGGGWPLGRISNVVGNQATGKTLVAIEACANFAHLFPKGEIHYREAEAAFDNQYAEALGMPLNRVNFGNPETDFATVEDFFEDLTETITTLAKKKIPGLYIVDSLDALSDRDELDRDIDKGTYGAGKAKKMSEIFRRLVKQVEASRVHLMIISQVRDNLAFGFKKTSRSGGRALDFYASQIIELIHMEALTSTKQGVKRHTGINVKVKCTKNKVALPLREATFDIVFGLGIDRLNACLDWLKEVKRLDLIGTNDKDLKAYLSQIETMSDEDYWNTVVDIEGKVTEQWYKIEESFLPKRKKGYALTAQSS